MVQLDAAFASHSLGEFSALTAVADILPNSSLIDIVFYYSLTMQHTVEHDEQGHSNYAMFAINKCMLNVWVCGYLSFLWQWWQFHWRFFQRSCHEL